MEGKSYVLNETNGMNTNHMSFIMSWLMAANALTRRKYGKQTNREDRPPLTSVLVETIELDTTVGKIKA